MERSVLNALKASDVKEEDIKFLQKKFTGKFFNVEECDKELIKLGYEPVFVLDFDEDEDDDDYDHDGYEKKHQKKYFDE